MSIKDQKVELVNLIKDACSDQVKICLASRNPLSDAFVDVPEISMHSLNRAGIEAFAFHTMQKFFDPKSGNERAGLENLAQDIAQNSEGVFLWARFVLFEMIDGKAEGENQAALHRRLEGVPPELTDVYSRIFQNRAASEKEESGTMLRLICSSKRTLTVTELFEAMNIARSDEQDSHHDFSESYSEVLEKWILAITGGVLETFTGCIQAGPKTDRRNFRYVQTIHRTIQTYLDMRGWSELFGETEKQ